MMEPYIYKRNKDGINYLDLAKTWEKLMVAARIISAVQQKNTKDVLVSAQSHSRSVCLDRCLPAERAMLAISHRLFFLDCVQPSVRSESRAQVRHLHRC